MDQIFQIAKSYYAIPPLARILIVIAFFIAVMAIEKLWKKSAAYRWKGYSLWLAMALGGMAFGFCLDIMTIHLSPSYYTIGKGVTIQNPFLTSVEVGGVAGFLAGIILGGGLLLKAKDRVRLSKTIPWRELKPMSVIIFCAALGALLAWILPLLKSPDPYFTVRLKPEEIESFFKVQQIHAGAYLLALISWTCFMFKKNPPAHS